MSTPGILVSAPSSLIPETATSGHSRYYEDTSPWTLDYPPFFAWMEWLLAQAAQFVDRAMLEVENLDYASYPTVVFQRLSVMFTEVVLIGAGIAATRGGKGNTVGHWKGLLTYVLLVGNAGLIMVDHIHFQYNGVMMGLLLWSILCINQQRDLLGGCLFAVLLNMKHLFAYCGPLYFVYLLRHYCWKEGQGGWVGFTRRLVQLGGAVVGICGLSLGPFLLKGQIKQILSRLFPFGRGLCHAYWAPNFWALYSFADKMLVLVMSKLGRPVRNATANMTGGVVGVSAFSVLPQVGPGTTMLAVLLGLVPLMIKVWRRPRPRDFALAVAYSNFCGFMFGYHVHEKALLPVVLPLALVAGEDPCLGADFLLISTTAHYALFPLLYGQREYPIKVLLVLVYFVVSYTGLVALQRMKAHGRSGGEKSVTKPSGPPPDVSYRVLPGHYRVYLLGLVLVELYSSFLHDLVFADRLPFLPLMLTSVYCALGLSWGYLRLLVGILADCKAKEE